MNPINVRGTLRLISRADKDEYKELFDKLDADASGTVTSEELDMFFVELQSVATPPFRHAAPKHPPLYERRHRSTVAAGLPSLCDAALSLRACVGAAGAVR